MLTESVVTRRSKILRPVLWLALLLALLPWLYVMRDELAPTQAGAADAAEAPGPQRLQALLQQAGEQGRVKDPAPHAPGVAAPSPVPFYGFCPEDDQVRAAPDRPNLSEQLSLRVSEMLDRARAARRRKTSSQELRSGLRALFAKAQGDRALALLRVAPDRRDGDFDQAAAAALILGARAHGAGKRRRAFKLAREAVRGAPQDAMAHALLALSAAQLGEGETELRALRTAHALEPDEPVFALRLGRALAHTPNLDAAVAALDRYLQWVPEDVPIAQLRARLDTQRQIQDEYGRRSHRGITLSYASEAIDADAADRLLQDLDRTLDEAAQFTALPRRALLHVVAYPSRSELLASTCVPSWTQGVFDGTLRLHADALRTPRQRSRVVRHEILHAQMRDGRVNAPQWFHEGVAQFFARERGPAHMRSYRLMARNSTYIPFPSLEGSFLVIGAGKDARLAYHQSLAMVELLTVSSGEDVVARAVRTLQEQGGKVSLMAPPVAARALDADDLLAYLRATVEQPR